MPPRPPCHGPGGGITTARLVGAGGLLCCPRAALGSSPAPGRNAHTLAPHRLTHSPFSRQTTPQREGRGPCQIRRQVPGASPQPQVSTSSQHEAPSQDAGWEPVLSSTPDARVPAAEDTHAQTPTARPTPSAPADPGPFRGSPPPQLPWAPLFPKFPRCGGRSPGPRAARCSHAPACGPGPEHTALLHLPEDLKSERCRLHSTPAPLLWEKV